MNGDKQFVFGTERFRVPAELDATFQFLATARSFVVDDLPGGQLEIDRVEFCRDLIRGGLLQLAA